MKRRTVLAQLAVFAVISVVIIAYTTFSLLGVHITNGPFSMTVQLRTAGGIFDGAEVAYRGVMVGRVTKVGLATTQVTLTLAIDHGTKVPDNAIAHVYDLSAVGEQYVDLVPSGPSGSYLHAGSVIPADRTTTPLQTATVLYDLERFVDSINPHDVQVIGQEGAAAFGDTGPQLKSLLADTITIVNQLSSTQGAALDLLKNSSTLLNSAAAHSTDFDMFARSLNELTSSIATSTPQLDAFLRQAAPTTQLVNSLISANGSALAVLLANLATLSDIQVARIPGLRSLLVAVPEFGANAPSVVHNGALLGATNFNLSEALCPTGVPLSNPLSRTRTSLQSVSCNQDILPRGANNAPRPGGAAAPDSGSVVGTYDVATGLMSVGDGSTVRLGVNGGQAELFGNNSWEAMLLALTGS